MFLVVGLGNPGSKYSYNWHNCGFMALEVLSQRHRITIGKTKFNGEFGKGDIDGHEVVLLRPNTFMNLSGESVKAAADFFKISPDHIIVIYDDIDIDVGTVRARDTGGPGTHNGMRSVVASLGTNSFPRVRVGCGPVPEHWDIADYVLSDIPKDRQELMFEMFVESAKQVESKISGGTWTLKG